MNIHKQKVNLNVNFTPSTKLNSKWIIDLFIFIYTYIFIPVG